MGKCPAQYMSTVTGWTKTRKGLRNDADVMMRTGFLVSRLSGNDEQRSRGNDEQNERPLYWLW